MHSGRRKQNSFILGQRPKREYVNKFTEFFFKEIDKGLKSPFMFVTFTVITTYAIMRVINRTIRFVHDHNTLENGTPISIPFNSVHDTIFQLPSNSFNKLKNDSYELINAAACAKANSTSTSNSNHANVNEHESNKANQSTQNKQSQVYDTSSIMAGPASSEYFGITEVQHPQIVSTDLSELHLPASRNNPHGEVDLICLELPEYDPTLRNDAYYRSVHYLPVVEPSSEFASNTTHTSINSESIGEVAAASPTPIQLMMNENIERQNTQEITKPHRKWWSSWWREEEEQQERKKQPFASSTSSTSERSSVNRSESEKNATYNNQTSKASHELEKRSSWRNSKPEPTYLDYMPHHGEELVHGMVKCATVTSQNNCVPLINHVEEEVERKLALTLGPVHALESCLEHTFYNRFTTEKKIGVETLVIGLHGGTLPRWLSQVYPNFNVNVVEQDGALVRLCKRFLGFQESNNLKVTVMDPVEFVQILAAKNTYMERAKKTRYQLMLVNAVDGLGRLDKRYGHLEFINNVRNCLSFNGCVALTIPNKDASFLFSMVQNWRLVFANRTVLLIHCLTTPESILMTFQDNKGDKESNIGSVVNVKEFQDLIRAHAANYIRREMPFDLPNEINENNFVILESGKTYSLSDLLPRGHPKGYPLDKSKTPVYNANQCAYNSNNISSSNKTSSSRIFANNNKTERTNSNNNSFVSSFLNRIISNHH